MPLHLPFLYPFHILVGSKSVNPSICKVTSEANIAVYKYLRFSFHRPGKLIFLLLKSMGFFDGLERDLVEQSLMRTPYQFHSRLKLVCKASKDMIENCSFYDCRKVSGLSEKLICLLFDDRIMIYDRVRDSWYRLPLPAGFKPASDPHLVCWRRKLVLIGLEYDNRETQPILVYDFCFNRWHVNNEMPRMCLLTKFACASAQGTVYVVAIHVAAVYDIDKDKWELLPPIPHPTRPLTSGLFIEGMFYVFGVQNRRTQRFDPNTRVWTTAHNMPKIRHYWNALYAFGKLFVFGVNEITEQDLDNGNSREVTRFDTPFLVRSAAVWCDQIFLAGIPYPPIWRYHQAFYMLKPNATDSERLIPIEKPEKFPETNALTVATVEI
ncbi:hypothetical protein SUGI_0701610 [Cryptomeria japonica]|nr:hypothetical protein SUGI_0701610 [Cryptomeria japonica]